MEVTQSKPEDEITVNRRQSTLSFSVGDITEVPVPDAPNHYSVTAVLNYCKNKILKPYLRLLSVVGLRPLFTESHGNFSCLEFFSYLYTLQVIVFMVIGYVLQYMACFRRDRGFGFRSLYSEWEKATYEQVCHGSAIFSYVVPDLFHLVGYLYAVAVFRSSDDDQLPSLMERVFLSLSNLSEGFLSQRKLVKILWIFVAVSLLWMTLSFISVNLMMAESTIDFKWVKNSSYNVIVTMKVFLVICTLWHDMIQATVISNYCLQAQLLASYLQFLRAKLLQHPIEPVEWMRDIQEFRKLMKFFNHQLAPAVCIFTLINVSSAISGVLWILDYDNLDKEAIPIISISILNIILWVVISFAPFVQAARLSNECEFVRSIGHEVRAKPFVHQSTPGYKLDSLLLYSSSLRLNAKLFGMPIRGKYLSLLMTVSVIVLLVLGQLHYLNIK